MKHEMLTLHDEKIIIPCAESYKDCITLIRSDYFRFNGEIKSSFFRLFFLTLYSSSWAYTFWLRIASYRKGFLWPFARLVLFFLAEHTHVHISYKSKIGYGLYIGHGIDMVVNPNAVIGNNVNLSQFLNIGSSTREAAKIGNNVYIGPHCCVVGDIVIGSDVTIGAGSVVVKDIPQNATAVGNPCKVVNYDNPRKCIGNLWPLPQIDILEQ